MSAELGFSWDSTTQHRDRSSFKLSQIIKDKVLLSLDQEAVISFNNIKEVPNQHITDPSQLLAQNMCVTKICLIGNKKSALQPILFT